MKLKNVKTGEIATLTLSSNGEELLLMKNNEMVTRNVKLSDLEEWEDYEEPKEHWAIDQFGEPINVTGLSRLQLEKLRQFGNDFGTKEETEQAVEKLKAWKRLKDKSEFETIAYEFDAEHSEGHIDFFIPRRNTFDTLDLHCVRQNLDLLFGGEE